MSLNPEPKMDRNYWLALILSMAVMMAYSFYIQKTTPPPTQDKISEPSERASSKANGENPILESAIQKAEGPFLEKPKTASISKFENHLYEADLSSYGGSITRLIYQGEVEKSGLSSVPFYHADPLETGLFSVRLTNDPVDLSRSVFRLKKQEKNSFQFSFEKPGDYRIEKTIEFGSGEPIIGVEVQIENLSTQEKTFPLEFIYHLDTGNIDPHDRPMVQVVVRSDSIKEANIDKLAKKGFSVAENIQWAGIVKKYFALLVKPDWKALQQDARAREGHVYASLLMDPLRIPAGGAMSKHFFIYAGPQRYEILKSFRMGFEDVMSRGFFGFFKITLLRTLKFLYRFTHNYGWAIIILTLILKGLFAPLTHMSFDSMKKMQALQPKMKSLQEHYKNDPTKLNQKMMELYKKNKVNPMSGCLPMLLQIPIFIAFYQMLNEAIELKGAPFILWIADLAEPDVLFKFPFSIPFLGDSFHLLPIFMILSMVIQQRMTPQMGSTPEQAKMMNIMMPAVFGFLFYKMPSGLVLYWFMNNLLTIIHQGIVKKAAVALHIEESE